MDDRRSVGRTRTSKAASLIFGGQPDGRSCEVQVTDLASGGAGIFKKGLALLPLTFELSFDNLRRKCRIVWRKGNSFGVAFENQDQPIPGEPEVGADIVIGVPAFSMLSDSPQLVRSGNVGVLTEFASKIVDQNDDRRSDVRFTVGVVVALALPVLISIGAYIVMTAALGLG